MSYFHKRWNEFVIDDGMGWWELAALLGIGLVVLAVLAPGSTIAGFAMVVLGLMLAALVMRALIAWWSDPLNLYDLF